MKLYWRIKKKGKWTWRPAIVVDHVYIEGHDKFGKTVLMEEEE